MAYKALPLQRAGGEGAGCNGEVDGARLDVAGQADGELWRSEDMQRRRPGGQIVVGRDAPNKRALARLAYAKVARVEHAKAHLPIQL